MSTTFGPNYSANQQIINTMVSGATIFAIDFNSVLSNLNISSASMGSSIGDFAGFTFSGSPFSQATDLVTNIVAGYNSAVSQIPLIKTDVGAIIYKHKNLGGF